MDRKQESNEESESIDPPAKPCEAIDQDKLISLLIQPQRDYLARYVPNSVNVLCQVQSLPARTRPSIELVVVMDCSGSMGGSKLQFAKRAIRKCIKHMSHEAGDIIHFVKYDTKVTIGFEEGNLLDKKKLNSIVKEAQASGSTNLAGGLLQGLQLLKQSRTRPPRCTQRLFLFSDGRANVGVALSQDSILQIIKRLKSHGVSVSSFGLGLDFDEDLMHAIASEGQGDYFFISSAQEITKFMSQALKGIKSLIGRNASLTITPPPGTKLVKIYGQQASLTQHNIYNIGDIIGDNTRNVVFQLETKAPNDSDLKLELCKCSLNYDSVATGQPSRVFGQLSMACTDDVEKLKENVQVLTALLIKRSCEIDRETKRLIDEGSFEQAILVKEAVLAELQEFEPKTPEIQRLIQISKEGLQIIKLIPASGPSGIAPRPRILKKSQVQFESADWSIQRRTGAPPKTTTSIRTPRTMVPTKPAVPPAVTTARKHFDSADWYASKDSRFNWKDDKGSDSDSWSSEDEKSS